MDIYNFTKGLIQFFDKRTMKRKPKQHAKNLGPGVAVLSWFSAWEDICGSVYIMKVSILPCLHTIWICLQNCGNAKHRKRSQGRQSLCQQLNRIYINCCSRKNYYGI